MSLADATEVNVRRADRDDLPALAVLFDAYRVFYAQASDLERARTFIGERLSNGDSHLLLALDGHGNALGFTQLYPSFTSVGTARIEILNDLFVVPQARGLGVGRSLLRRAAKDARGRGAVKLVLSTALDNLPAQTLYAAEGWERDTEFAGFSRKI